MRPGEDSASHLYKTAGDAEPWLSRVLLQYQKGPHGGRRGSGAVCWRRKWRAERKGGVNRAWEVLREFICGTL